VSSGFKKVHAQIAAITYLVFMKLLSLFSHFLCIISLMILIEIYELSTDAIPTLEMNTVMLREGK
jgi:hypothetical protein